MRCPFCGKEDTQVKDSRASDDGATIRRRRLCTSCGSRFTTFERIQLRDLSVIKRNGKKIPFDRDKLMKSMLMALRKRQINDDDIAASSYEINTTGASFGYGIPLSDNTRINSDFEYSES
mgnify:CR=1 FL=1